MIRRLLRILLIPLLLLGLGYASQELGLVAFEHLKDYSGPSLGPLPVGRATAQVSGRVVVVVVDGLREDTSHRMPAFQQLRERGADLPSWAELPAISLPGYATLGTGTYPEFSGVTTNWYEGPLPIDSIFSRAQEAGLPTALATMTLWERLYLPWADYIYTAPWSPSGDYRSTAWTTEAIGQVVRNRLKETDVALLYVHFGEVDEAGHQYGGDSPEYLESALHVDTQIAILANVLDWSRDTLILTADHGMTDDLRGAGGGHGGAELESRRVPLVMVGRGIAPGVYPDGGQADVAPTIATLLGLPIPAHSQGRTRLDALVLTAEQRADKALALAEQQETLYYAYLRSLGAVAEANGLSEARAAMDTGAYDQVEELVQSYLDRLEADVARAAANRLWQERLIRLPYLVLPLAAGAVFVGLYRSRRELLWPLLATSVFFSLHLLLYWAVHGFTLSFSTIRAQSEEAFFLARTVDAVIVMVLVAIIAGILRRRRPWKEVVWEANLSALIIAWVFAVQLGLFLWLYGLRTTWQLPDMRWGFKYYLDLLTTIGVGYAGFFFPWLVLGISRLFFAADWIRDHWREWWQFIRYRIPWQRPWALVRRLLHPDRKQPTMDEESTSDSADASDTGD